MKFFKIFNIKKLLMDFGRLVISPLILFYRPRVYNKGKRKKNLRIKGGAIIVANHTSFKDPFIVTSTFWRRRVHFLAAENVMNKQPRCFLLKQAGCIKIDRTIVDYEAIKKAIKVLNDGYVLTIFPQGGINREDQLKEMKTGAVFMAFQANVPIVLMYNAGRKHWYNRQKIILGERINLREYCSKKIPSLEDMDNISNIILDRLIQMQKEVK